MRSGVRTPPARAIGKPLNVIILSDHGYVNGGQAKVAIDSALSLAGRGHNVCFVAGRGPVDARLPASGIECRIVGEHDILSNPNRFAAAVNGIWNLSAARVVADCIAARDPSSTVVHVHGWAKALSPSIGPVVTRSRAAHLYTLHEYFLGCPNGGFYDYKAGRICTRRALGVQCLATSCDSRASAHKAWRVARQAVLWTAGKMPRDLREILCLAPEQRSILGAYVPQKARWHHLPNPVAPAARRIVAERNNLFLFVGRLSPEKGAAIAAAAARLAGVEFAVCGDGECSDAVLEANPDAIMAGWVGPEDLSNWMRRARCIVFPSLWYEGYPLVVAEAIRAGLPVIVSDSSVAASSVRNGIDGLHARAGDTVDWARAMSALQSDDVVQAYSKAAFAAGRNLLDEVEYTSRLVDIYRSVIARRNGTEAEPEAVGAC